METDSNSKTTGDRQAEELLQELVSTLQRADRGHQGSSDMAYQITGDLKITQDPAHYLLDSPTGEEYRGLRKFNNAPGERVPNESAYISGELPGDVSTKEELCRALLSPSASPLLIGDAGTAKNTSIDSVYNTIGQPVYRMQCGSGLTVYDLFSETEMRDGETVTTLKPFGLAAVFGGLAVADEINLANDRLIAHINSMAEERGQRRVTLPGTGVTLVDLPEDEEWNPSEHLGKYLHPEFRVAATRNPPTYSGAHEINNALNDRFSPIRYEYAGVDVESQILAEEVGCEKGHVEPLVETVQSELREPRARGNGITCPISYRRLRDALEFAVSHNTTLYDAAMNKLRWYAQNEMDRMEIEGALEDRKHTLEVFPGSGNTKESTLSYNCTECSWLGNESGEDFAAKHGVCPDCGSPTIKKEGEDMWERGFKSQWIGGIRWGSDESADKGRVYFVAWDNDNSKAITYLYRDVPRSKYEELLDCNRGLGSLVNEDLKGGDYESVKVGEGSCKKPSCIL